MFHYTSLPCLSLICLAFICVSGCRQPEVVQVEPKPLTVMGHTMGTNYTIKLWQVPEGINEKKLSGEISDCLRGIHGKMSTYLMDSEVSRFNRSEGSDWLNVSKDTLTVVAKAQEISEQTDGAFDITVGPLVNLWSFGAEHRQSKVPSVEAIHSARQTIGFQKIEYSRDRLAIKKSDPSVYIDLSAIAKGFAVDQVVLLLGQQGIQNYMVEIGGEVLSKGNNQKGKPWRIGIEHPARDVDELYAIVEPRGRALATSGDYRIFFEHQGTTYSHTIDPRTGWPVKHGLASVSVIADDCMSADGWATALMVLGPEEGLNVASKHGIHALFIFRDKGSFSEHSTPGFREHVVPRDVKK